MPLFVAPRLLFTARHVIEEYWEKLTGKKFTHENHHDNMEIFAVQFIPDRDTANIWRAVKIYVSTISDIALLAVAPASDTAKDYVWNTTQLNLRPPNIGDKLICFGYPEKSIEVSDDLMDIKIHSSSARSMGTTVEIHPEIRDLGTLKWPVFRTNALIKGGMSGGPIVNLADGKICGVNCYSLIAGDGNTEDSVSYGSSLWPSMGILVDIKIENDPLEGNYFLRMLAEKGILSAEHWEKVELDPNHQENMLIVKFHPS